jgi:aminoglycoside 6-adenylyltransferase
VNTGFRHSPGYGRRHLRRYIEPDLWGMLESTYSDASSDRTWEALHVMCDLFRLVATSVAEHFDFEYPRSDDERVSAHLKQVRRLPKDAEGIRDS